MAADSKTEKATPKKRRDQRKEGNVFQSNDIINLVGVFGSFYALKVLFPGIHQNLRDFMVKFIDIAGSLNDTSMGSMQLLGYEFIKTAVRVALPLMLICVALSVLSAGVQTRFLFASKNFRPKFSRLDPIQGIKKLFSLKNAVELVKNILKVILLIIIIYYLLKSDLTEVIRMMDMDISASVISTFDMVMVIIMRVTLVFAAVAAFDYLYQWWDYERQIKMSKQEVKEEMKETEGNPEVKGRIKDIQRQRARTRMMQAVPEADVIIRNPTHFAVALKYDMDHNSAPVVVAKGQDELALRIVKIGEEHGVTVIENKPLARGIFSQSELNQEIPAEYYGAVAEILVYVYKLNNKWSKA